MIRVICGGRAQNVRERSRPYSRLASPEEVWGKRSLIINCDSVSREALQDKPGVSQGTSLASTYERDLPHGLVGLELGYVSSQEFRVIDNSFDWTPAKTRT